MYRIMCVLRSVVVQIDIADGDPDAICKCKRRINELEGTIASQNIKSTMKMNWMLKLRRENNHMKVCSSNPIWHCTVDRCTYIHQEELKWHHANKQEDEEKIQQLQVCRILCSC